MHPSRVCRTTGCQENRRTAHAWATGLSQTNTLTGGKGSWQIKETVEAGAVALPTTSRGTMCARMHTYLPLVRFINGLAWHACHVLPRRRPYLEFSEARVPEPTPTWSQFIYSGLGQVELVAPWCPLLTSDMPTVLLMESRGSLPSSSLLLPWKWQRPTVG